MSVVLGDDLHRRREDLLVLVLGGEDDHGAVLLVAPVPAVLAAVTDRVGAEAGPVTAAEMAWLGQGSMQIEGPQPARPSPLTQCFVRMDLTKICPFG